MKLLKLKLFIKIMANTNQCEDKLYLDGFTRYVNGEMNPWQFYRFCERHGFLAF